MGGSHTNPGSAEDAIRMQRKEARHSMRRQIEIAPCSSSVRLTAEVFDCSVHGIGLLIDRSIQSGEEFLLYLNSTTESVVMYTARNCTRMPDGRFKVGAAF